MFKSIESFKSAFPYFLGCRSIYTSQAVSVSSPVKLDYGCIIYGSARKSYLQMLDPIRNQGLGLALGVLELLLLLVSMWKQMNHHYTHEERNSLCNML